MAIETILGLAGRNWRLFPVRAKAKLPLITDWPHKATTDRIRLEEWAERFPGCNWGMVTGPDSGVFVLDVDGEQGLASVAEFQSAGKELPRTLTTHTGKGSHVYFRWPDGIDLRNSAGKLAPGLDVRANGGYVVVPPSVHPNGSAYEFVDESISIAPAPEWMRDALAGKLPDGGLPQDVGSQPVDAAIPKGRRNHTLASLAGLMRRKGMGPQSIQAALLAENLSRCTPPLSDSEVCEIARSVSKYQPVKSSQAVRRHAAILTLSEVKAREVDWLWNPYLALGTLAMLSGDPGAGKTFIALAIASALTTGRIPYYGEPCTPGNVLYLSVENSPECVLRPRFDLLGGDASRFHLLQGSICADTAERGAVRLADVTVLQDAIQKTKARLVAIDPIQSYLGAEVDAHRSNETRPLLDGLARLASEFGCCILLIRHLSKAPTSRAIHRGLGSIDLTGAVRTELMAGSAPGPSTERALVQVKNNLGRFGKSLGYMIEEDGAFRWTGESELTASALLAAEGGGDGEGAGSEAEEFLRYELRDGAQPAKEISRAARQAGISERTLRRARARLGITARKRGMEAGWEWELPEGGQP